MENASSSDSPNDLTNRFGRGFSKVNLKQMRKFYQVWSGSRIGQTPSDKFARASIPQ